MSATLPSNSCTNSPTAQVASHYLLFPRVEQSLLPRVKMTTRIDLPSSRKFPIYRVRVRFCAGSLETRKAEARAREAWRERVVLS